MSSPDVQLSFTENLAAVVARRGDAAAVETAGGEVVSYAALWSRALVLRDEMRAQGLRGGEVVALELPRSAEFMIALIAVWLCEAVALPLEVMMPARRKQEIVEEAKPRLVLTKLQTVARCGDVTRFEAQRAAYLIYTSGSMGRPKGVLVSHAGLVPVLKAQIEIFRLREESRCLWMHGTAFDASLSDIGTALLAGAALCFDAERPHALELLRRLRITHVDMPPALLPFLEDAEALETIIIGGEVCAPVVVRKWAARVRLVNVYGPTEATICTSMVLCDAAWERAWIGTPLPGVEYHVSDDGELWISGAAVALGYPWLPELQRERFVEDGRTYRTGDRVRRHDGGGLEFLGRLDRQMKVNGRLICPEEIEQALLGEGQARRAHVFELRRGGRSLLAAGVESETSSEKLRECLRARFPAWMVPREWFLASSLPSLANGKIDARAISAALELQIGSRAVLAEKAFSDDEVLIRRFFEESLQVSEIGPEEDFFDDLGGDSLAVVACMVMAMKAGVFLPADALHRARTVRGVARLWRQNADEGMGVADLKKEVRLEMTFRTAAAEKPRCILITGASGFLGTTLMRELGEVRVIPLSRRTGGGDVRRPFFGWEESRWHELADEVDTVVHLAAEVRLFAPYAELKATQVDGTLEVLRFCAAGRPKTLHAASSLAVFVDADPPMALCREDDLRRDITQMHGGYAQSKWVAEQLVLAARERGLRAAVHRLGLLSLDNVSGAGPSEDWLTLALPGLVGGAVDDAERAFDLTPVDYAARVMAWLVCGSCEGVFHIANPQPVTLARLASLCTKPVSANDFALLAGGRAHRTLDLFKCTHTRFDMSATQQALAGSGIVFPSVTEEYLRRCLRHAEMSTTP